MNDCERIKAACRAAGWDVDNVAVDRDGDWWAYSHKESDDVCLGSEAMLRADINGAFAGFRFPRIPAPDPTPHWSGFRVGQRVERLRKCDDGSMSVVYSGVITGMDDHSVDVGDCYSVTWPEVKAGLLRAVTETDQNTGGITAPTGGVRDDSFLGVSRPECADDDCHAPRLICADCEAELPPEKLTWQYHPAHGHVHNQPGILGADWLCEYCGRRGHDKYARPWANEGGLGIARHDPPAIHDDDPNALDALPGWED